MTAKEYLGQLGVLEHEIHDKQEELARLNDLAASCSSPKLSDMPKAHNGHDQVADMVIKIISLQNSLNNKIDQLIDLKHLIHDQIDQLINPMCRIILIKRYVNLKDWLTIANEVDLSVQRCYQFHGIALAEFSKKFLN